MKLHYRTLGRVEYIYHGQWSDPELIYKKHSFNYWSIEDTLYNMFIEDCEYTGDRIDVGNIDEQFNRWLSKNRATCYAYLDELVYYQDLETKEFHEEYLGK